MRNKRVKQITLLEKQKPEGTTSSLILKAKKDYIKDRFSLSQNPKVQLSKRQARMQPKRFGFPVGSNPRIVTVRRRVICRR